MRTITKFLLAFLFLSSLSSFAIAEVVYYTDDDGRTHFVSNKEKVPEEFRYQLKGQKLAPITKVKAKEYKPSGSSRYAVGRSKKVTMYVTSWCSVCVHAEKYMKSKGIPFTKHDVERNSRARKEFKALGGRGVPLIKVGNKVMKGFSAAKLQSYLKN